MFQKAFQVLGQRSGGSQEWSVDRAKLLELVQEKGLSANINGLWILKALANFLYMCSCAGEHLTEIELVEHLMTLLGATDNPEVEGSFTDHPTTVLADLPNQLTAKDFAEDLLGLAT